MKFPPNTVLGITSRLADAEIALIRRCLDADGYAYLTHVSDDFDHARELRKLGEPVPQYHGALVRDVTPDPAISDAVVSAANTAELTPHTESYEFPGLPPRYVALWCVRPAQGEGGETTLADGYRFLDCFDPIEQRALHTNIYEWRSRPSLAREGVIMSARHPILTQHPAGLVMRYSNLDLVRSDDLVERYIDDGLDFFNATRFAVRIERNAVLIWDNWRMLHARNAFTDRNRLLRRILIAGDLGTDAA